MVPQDAIKQLIHEVETVWKTYPFDLSRAWEIGSRWSGADDSPIVEDTALDRKLFNLECVHTEFEAKLLIRDIRNLAEKELE